MIQVVLNKGGETFIFYYEEGGEEDLLATFLDFAKNPEINFDSIDAAILTRRIFDGMQSCVSPKHPEIVLLRDEIRELISKLICSSAGG